MAEWTDDPWTCCFQIPRESGGGSHNDPRVDARPGRTRAAKERAPSPSPSSWMGARRRRINKEIVSGYAPAEPDEESLGGDRARRAHKPKPADDFAWPIYIAWALVAFVLIFAFKLHLL
jgi:hypothetical protein